MWRIWRAPNYISIWPEEYKSELKWLKKSIIITQNSIKASENVLCLVLTIILLTFIISWTRLYASSKPLGFNSASKWLNKYDN